MLEETCLGRLRGLYILKGKFAVSGDPTLRVELCGLLSLPSVELPGAPRDRLSPQP